MKSFSYPKKLERDKNLEKTELIILCQSGDKSSLSELYRLYSKKALGTAYLISDHKGIAEDIMQEAFIQCFNEISTLKNPEKFEIWFYKILIRTGWRMVKKHNYFIPFDTQGIEDISSDMGLNLGLELSDTRLSINQAMEKLSLPLKTVIILYYFNDMSIKEISEVLGCFQGTVKSRLHNAKKQLYCELYGTFYENELPNSLLKSVNS